MNVSNGAHKEDRAVRLLATDLVLIKTVTDLFYDFCNRSYRGSLYWLKDCPISARSWLSHSFPDKITIETLKNLVTSNTFGVTKANHLASGAMRKEHIIFCSATYARIRTHPFLS